MFAFLALGCLGYNWRRQDFEGGRFLKNSGGISRSISKILTRGSFAYPRPPGDAHGYILRNLAPLPLPLFLQQKHPIFCTLTFYALLFNVRMYCPSYTNIWWFICDNQSHYYEALQHKAPLSCTFPGSKDNTVV
jgi:hypothetical protein